MGSCLSTTKVSGSNSNTTDRFTGATLNCTTVTYKCEAVPSSPSWSSSPSSSSSHSSSSTPRGSAAITHRSDGVRETNQSGFVESREGRENQLWLVVGRPVRRRSRVEAREEVRERQREK
ncbi:unnamed protein product [Camellia sinensis]